ncbi:MAG: patatin-like phospholipase family protein, partial [Defluviitaleaceae bacterium]|nr:patatin-like phospholipase family protein [Defluviitaleaceae bacterium]
FKDFSEGSLLTKFGYPGMVVKLLVRNGIYSTNSFEEWLGGLLEKKGKRVFGDLKTGCADPRFQYRFQAVASDLTDGDMLVLPRDLSKFGFVPDKFSIARAVRMSISIPMYYEPVVLTDIDGKKHLIVDGGLLSNYPLWLLDDGTSDPSWTTFGFRFNADEGRETAGTNTGLVEYLKSLARTAMDGIDKHYVSVSKGDFARTISISPVIRDGDSTKKISTVYFGITPEECEALYQNGVEAGREFLAGWDFEEWKRMFRKGGAEIYRGGR